jgi:hypothetical protein
MEAPGTEFYFNSDKFNYYNFEPNAHMLEIVTILILMKTFNKPFCNSNFVWHTLGLVDTLDQGRPTFC